MIRNDKFFNVKIREKPLKDNRVSLYLDWHDGTGKRKKEYSGLYKFVEPLNKFEREHNKEVNIQIESLRAERMKQFFSGDIDIALEKRKLKNQDFIEFFSNYINNYKQKDVRVMRATLKHFIKFNPPPLSAKDVDEKLCRSFKDYLKEQLNRESQNSYFSRFKKVLTEAVREKVFIVNPAIDIKNTQGGSIPKEILSIEDIQKLVNAECGNLEVKRAFLFACYTGLRFCDIEALKWKNIKGSIMVVNQLKTERQVSVNLNQVAVKLLGEANKAEENVFRLPSSTGTNKVIAYWVKRAGIDKHITFHCARHSFGTNLMMYGGNISTVASLLGHTSWKHTQKYVRAVESLKEEAVNKLPSLNIDI